MAKVAVLGHGVVGSGVVELFEKSQASIAKKAGQSMEVKRILDLREFPSLSYADRFTKDFDEILNDPEIVTVAEVMGGLHPAYEYTKAALEAGKNVVTSNKELVAEKGADLLAVAKANNVNYFFEASVGGGIPIIRPMHMCLAANEIDEVVGILNGTTNFILTKMIHEQMKFSDALKLAQQLGYAERNPAADVEGHDACRKICILASLAYGKQIYPEAVHTDGITGITLEDVDYAENWGGVIKLIGFARRLPEEMVEIFVGPAFVSHESQLANIDDVFNGILVRGDATGDVVFYGKGAGKLPTASAVVADMIHVTKLGRTSNSLTWIDDGKNHVADYLDGIRAFYVRCVAEDVEDAKLLIHGAFGDVKQLSRDGMPENELAFITGEIPERQLLAGIQKLSDSGVKTISKIRVLAD